MKSRPRLLALAGMALLALGFGSTTLWAQPITVSDFSANGQGNTIFTNNTPCPGLTCSDGTPTDCACDETTGSITGTGIATGTFILKDQLFIPLTNSNGTQ